MSGERGSLLLEAIVAVAIVGLVLATMFQVMQDAARRTGRVEQARLALLTAESQLAAVGTATPLVEGSTTGMDGDIAWQVDVSPDGGGVDGRAGRLERVTVTAADRRDGGGRVRLSSLRLAPSA